MALEIIPSYAVNDKAIIHHQLGAIFFHANNVKLSLLHYGEAIRYFELQGKFYDAANTRYNTALALFKKGRFEDALEYANAALRNYQTFGNRAIEEINKTWELIAYIEHEKTGGG
jgi:tetratricopeptide (TPR) repeat protein